MSKPVLKSAGESKLPTTSHLLTIEALRNRPCISLPVSSLSFALNQLKLSHRPFHSSPRLQDLPIVPNAVRPLDRGVRKHTPAEKAELAAKRARESLKQQELALQKDIQLGGLADTSPFGPLKKEQTPETQREKKGKEVAVLDEDDLSNRRLSNLTRVLNPRPNARARWQRAQIIRHIRKGGRLTKEMVIARTERKHMSASYLFKTSRKKLGPLARQIAGKPIEEAILQMRFSAKQVAHEVHEHLIQARNEAIVVKGMGLKNDAGIQQSLPSGPVIQDPDELPTRPNENPNRVRKTAPDPTDIYVAEAWINQGPYGKEPEWRARGRMNILRPPHTRITVLLKEEKTRTREKNEKEIRQIKKRLRKSAWTQLPDRPVTNQSQYLLW
jgi:ribosomal protein L22